MKTFVVWLSVLLSSFSIFASRELKYICKNEGYEFTFTRVFSDIGTTEKVSLVIKDDDNNLYSFSNNARKNELVVSEANNLTIVKSANPQTLLSHLTLTNTIEASDRYEATLVLNVQGTQRTIEFSHCDVKNVSIPVARLYHQPYSAKLMR